MPIRSPKSPRESGDLGYAGAEHRFLGACRRQGARIEVVLTSGERVVGRLLAFDRFSLLLAPEGEEAPRLLFKEAVACVLGPAEAAASAPQARS